MVAIGGFEVEASFVTQPTMVDRFDVYSEVSDQFVSG